MNQAYLELAPGLKISRILTGLWQIADMERDGQALDLDRTAAAMQPYLAAGLTTFDMADHYGSAEIIAGKFRQSLPDPDQVQLLTKWVPPAGKISLQAVREAVERALGRLQTDRIDLLQYHAWNYADPSWLDQLFWLQELKAEGLIHHLGLTNFDTAHLNMALQSGIEVVSNQVCFSLLDQRAQNGMLELCQKEGIHILAFGTLAGGFLSKKWLGQPEPETSQLTTWSQMKYKRFISTSGGWEKFQNLLRTLDEVARETGATIPNIACRYLLDQPGVGGVIIGARIGQSEHIAENRRILDLELTDDQRARIAAARNGLDPIPGDCGDEYRKPPFLTASGDLSHHIDQLPHPYQWSLTASGRERVLSGTIWEELAGFSRAVRSGNRILVSGTTATHGKKLIGGSDPAAQTHFIIDKIEGVLQSMGSSLEQVVRTRIFISNIDDWEAVTRAHGNRFGHIQPANTLVRADLIGNGYLVEIEAEAEG